MVGYKECNLIYHHDAPAHSNVGVRNYVQIISQIVGLYAMNLKINPDVFLLGTYFLRSTEVIIFRKRNKLFIIFLYEDEVTIQFSLLSEYEQLMIKTHVIGVF